jgi:GxxExxY protein
MAELITEKVLIENDISAKIIDRAIYIHKELGPGLLESVYEEILIYEFRKIGLNCKRQVRLPVNWDNIKIDLGYIADLIVEDIVIIELKSIEEIHPVHKKQLLTYLKITNKKLGLLINFNVNLLKDGIVRVVNGL